MNYIFIPNAVVLVLLGWYTWRQRPGRLASVYLVTNICVAVWALCVLALHEWQNIVPVNQVSQLQMISALVFGNGFLYISLLYPPVHRPKRGLLNALNLVIASGFAGLILLSDFVSRAQLQDGVVAFIDGPGYLIYTLYLTAVGLSAIGNLILSYRRYGEFRVRVAYMLTGLGLFIVMAIIFDLILPLYGNYSLLAVGHLSSVFPSIFFAYAITKHDLLDITVVVQRNTAKIIVSVLIVVTLFLAFELSLVQPVAGAVAICLTGLVWAFCAHRLEVFLVTTARRKFVRSWYDTDSIMDRLAGTLELETSRRDIFRKLLKELDATFELERAHAVVAVRDEEEHAREYEVLDTDFLGALAVLPLDDELIEHCRSLRAPEALDRFPPSVQQRLAALGHEDPAKCLVVSFPSPEMLEGILVLGERSNQDVFSRRDRQFLSILVSYVSAILYRLTPFEKLEQLYFENQRRLHEAELQLVRSEKSKAIAHATRQAHHEIRTPLNIIRMSVRRITDMSTAERYKNIVEQQIERAMEIVEETLLITTGEESGHARLQPVDINHALLRSYRLLPENEHRAHIALAEDLPRVMGIAGELQVLFSNLLKNAIEAMSQPGTLSISSRQERDEVVVEIGDTGEGISPELREKIWEPYFSGKVTAVGNSTARRGWGLTICNRIISEHHGTIRVVSTPGEGTVFTIRLPAEPQDGREEEGEKSLGNLLP